MSEQLQNGTFLCKHTRHGCEYYQQFDKKGNCAWCGGARTKEAIQRLTRMKPHTLDDGKGEDAT